MLGKFRACVNSVYQAFSLAEGLGTRLHRSQMVQWDGMDIGDVGIVSGTIWYIPTCTIDPKWYSGMGCKYKQ